MDWRIMSGSPTGSTSSRSNNLSRSISMKSASLPLMAAESQLQSSFRDTTKLSTKSRQIQALKSTFVDERRPRDTQPDHARGQRSEYDAANSRSPIGFCFGLPLSSASQRSSRQT